MRSASSGSFCQRDLSRPNRTRGSTCKTPPGGGFVVGACPCRRTGNHFAGTRACPEISKGRAARLPLHLPRSLDGKVGPQELTRTYLSTCGEPGWLEYADR